VLARAGLLVCLLLPLGCLHPVEIPTVRLTGPSGAGVGLADSLGVVPLDDLRPRREKRGKAPWLVPLIIWNQRTGLYVTGSKHFGGDVSGEVSEAIAEALSGWRFGRGHVLPAGSDATLAERCAAEDLAYVASGEIRHLYGAVRQRSWLFIIPTPWVQGVLSGNEVGDPVGVVRLSLRIQDCRSGEQIASRRFVSEGLFPRLSPSAAAQRAFDRLMREVTDLSRVPADEAPAADGDGSAPAPPDAREPPPSEPVPSVPGPAPGEETSPESDEPVLVPL